MAKLGEERPDGLPTIVTLDDLLGVLEGRKRPEDVEQLPASALSLEMHATLLGEQGVADAMDRELRDALGGGL